ncbi:DUF599 domain-containing protein [Methylomicrobium sp. Wu6]|uniref:DUF599 domain-containing protein n=1 Tax=Methylomicrobium sp. Wu6 TaxID=3107928 RepID=UPI002DD62AF9|nr:DUF599 domain-containing protein [Methylomicrobium sp. Wu6]MEC4747099.1 DUF599 domain-containing protein [Methylomicrobium sp. Wu6]
MPIDLLAFAASSSLILLYYLFLRWRTRRDPDFSVHRFNRKMREAWVDMVAKNGKMDILAVQTLRNSVMAANFMASTSVLLIIGTLNLSDKIEKWAYAWQPGMAAESMAGELWLIKLGLLLFDFFIAFYCFTMAIRYFNHVGYMINLLGGSPEAGVSYQQVCAYLNRAGAYYTYGTRSFFFSLPLVLWFFGPYSLVLATWILIAAFYKLDRAP